MIKGEISSFTFVKAKLIGSVDVMNMNYNLLILHMFMVLNTLKQNAVTSSYINVLSVDQTLNLHN